MNARIEELLARIRELETELEADLEEKRARFHYHLEDRRTRFEQDILALHRRLRTGWLRYLLEAPPSHLLIAPVIYLASLPLLLLDLTMVLYQAICFPVCGIPKVRRADYFVYDRGLLAYAREIVGRTEQYWCPIKHARRLRDPHGHYGRFFDYGDAGAYRQELERLRREYPELMGSERGGQ